MLSYWAIQGKKQWIKYISKILTDMLKFLLNAHPGQLSTVNGCGRCLHPLILGPGSTLIWAANLLNKLVQVRKISVFIVSHVCTKKYWSVHKEATKKRKSSKQSPKTNFVLNLFKLRQSLNCIPKTGQNQCVQHPYSLIRQNHNYRNNST